jgi:hypothetical protein
VIDVRDRFRSLDAARPPDLWSESLARATSPRPIPRRLGGWDWTANRMAPLVLAAAAIFTAAVIGLATLRDSNVGDSPAPLGPSEAPTTQPTATPSSAAIDPQLGTATVAAARMAVVDRHVSAINNRSADAFAAAFLPEGVFTPGADFAGATSLFANSLAVSDTSEVEAWMAINRAWGFEVEVIECREDPAAPIVYGYGQGSGDPMVVRCEVATRWHRLSLEITERWSYEFHGNQLGHWAVGVLDLNPADRALRLGYDGLLAWEEALRVADPEAAARYLVARADDPPCMECLDFANSMASDDPVRAAQLAPLLVPADTEWRIDGNRFIPHGLIPYDPTLARDIEASIKRYLAEVQP